MGELRKKIGMTFMQITSYILIIILSFSLAVILQYRLLEKVEKTNIDMYIQYLVYFLFALSLLFFAILYIKSRLITAMNVYENGIVLKRRGETIMYSDIPTYYLIPRINKTVKYLIIEKGNGSRVLVDIDYAGDDFVDFFQKDYMTVNTNKALEKIKAGNEIIFGMLSKKQNIILKVFKGKNTVRNLEFEDKFYISSDMFKYKDLEYYWEDLDIDYDVQTRNVEIKDKNNNIIVSTYFSNVEKGEFAFNLMDILIEEAEEQQRRLLIDDNQDEENFNQGQISSYSNDVSKYEQYRENEINDEYNDKNTID